MYQRFVSISSASRVAGLALLSACGAARAQFAADFESPAYNGSATGVLTTGQQGWYLPAVAGSQDHNVFTYTGNSLTFSANPAGSGQFDGGLGNATGSARAQHTVDFSAGGVWTASWDCNGKWLGTGSAVDNIGSWSMQPSATARYFQQLINWGSSGPYSGPNSPPTNWTTTFDHFHIHWGYFTAASPAAISFAVPSTAWLDLPVDHWYHITVKWDFNAAQILQVSIKDLTTNGPTTTDDVTSLGWYLQGGPNSTNPLPTDVRVFAGGAGDASGWDNLTVAPFVGQSCYANCDNSTQLPFLNVADFSCFLTKYSAGDAYANCDGSTQAPILNVADFSCFLTKYAAGCSAP